MRKYLQKHKDELWNKTFLISFIGAIILLSTSLIINYYAASFATNNASNFVTDIILDNTVARDVDGIFIWGSIAFWVFVGSLLVYRLKYAPFILKSIALFVFIRSASISLTHIAPFPGQINITNNYLIHFFTFGGDLFFSGHTGLPFLLAILFWHNKALRYIFLATSILFAFIVLLGHYHYSIDVFAAFFITPTIAQLCRLFFDKDHQMFISNA